MEAKLTGRTTETTMLGKVNPRELNETTYYYYCTLYLTERIYEVIPVTSDIQYGDVAKLINAINPELFERLYVETNKVILLNQIYSLFMQASNEELSREFLYNHVTHLSKYDPELYEDKEEE